MSLCLQRLDSRGGGLKFPFRFVTPGSHHRSARMMSRGTSSGWPSLVAPENKRDHRIATTEKGDPTKPDVPMAYF